jgi:hypothetical protein
LVELDAAFTVDPVPTVTIDGIFVAAPVTVKSTHPAVEQIAGAVGVIIGIKGAWLTVILLVATLPQPEYVPFVRSVAITV